MIFNKQDPVLYLLYNYLGHFYGLKKLIV